MTLRYRKMDPQEFYLHSLKMLDTRLQLEKAAAINAQIDKGIGRATSPERAKIIEENYTMDATIEAKDFDLFGRDTVKICFKPHIDADGNVTVDRSMSIGRKQIKGKNMSQALDVALGDLRNYIRAMGTDYNYKRSQVYR